MRRGLALLFAVAAVAAACGGGGGPPRVTVLAAASLSSAFGGMKAGLERGADAARVTFSFAGSQQLVADVEQGAPADVVATADDVTMSRLVDGGHVDGIPRPFAHNRLAIAVATGNPKHVAGLADLARPDLDVVLAAPAVPAGRYAADVLRRAHVAVRPVSLEESVTGALTKVELGEADAAIVYVTDISGRGRVAAVAIPDDQNVVATYYIAVLRGRQRAGGRFVDFVVSDAGRAALQRAGFVPAMPA